RIAIVLALMIPALIELSLRLLAVQTLKGTTATPLLARIGVTGSDVYNGGLLGAAQFLGGNRITLCFTRGASPVWGGVTEGVIQYNCALSIAGMAALSVAAIA